MSHELQPNLCQSKAPKLSFTFRKLSRSSDGPDHYDGHIKTLTLRFLQLLSPQLRLVPAPRLLQSPPKLNVTPRTNSGLRGWQSRREQNGRQAYGLQHRHDCTKTAANAQ